MQNLNETATKKLNKIGANSKALIIPSRWCLMLGMTFGSTVHMEFDPINRILVVKPITPNSAYVSNYGASNDLTPQPRQVYPPSPHPKYTPAKWDKIPDSDKSFLLNQYEQEQEMRALNLDPDNTDHIEQYINAKKNRHLVAHNFDMLPHDISARYCLEVGQYITNGKNDTEARKLWVDTYNKSLTVNDNKRELMLSSSIDELIQRFGTDKYYDSSFDDEL